MIIGISGMIGSGKSTLAKGLHKHYKKSVLLEEFQENDPVFNTFLKWMYEKQPNIHIGFQSYIIESLSDTFKKTVAKFKNNNLNFRDNHIFLDRFNIEHYVFAVVTLMDKDPKYQAGFDAMFEKIVDPEDNPDLAVFIDIDFNTFKARLLARGRASEVDNYAQNETYFKLLHSLYKKLYIRLVEKFKIPYVIINSNNKSEKEVLQEAINIIDSYNFSKSKRYNE